MPDSTTRENQPPLFSDVEMIEARRMDDTQQRKAIKTTPPAPKVSYHDTRWPLVNRALALTERVTHGRAGVIQRLASYLLIGGTAALVNLGAFAIFGHFGSLKNFTLYAVVAYVTAYEVSILANFIPNDYFTFRFLPGHQRTWLARCTRFHLTSLSGVLVTFALSWIFYHPLNLPLLVAQALALILAVFYNFTAHHVFTYAKTHARDATKR
jgi:putative flippase GtrA